MTTDSALPLRIAAISPLTEVEGPGKRFAVWAQGCSIRCDGCFNPHLWGAAGGRPTGPDELAQQALASGAEGVTLLGGEPFDQADGFATFARTVRDGGLSVMTFTGHYLEDLRGPDAPPSFAALLAATDLLVDGPYLADQLDHARPWVGSRNQRFHFLTDRYLHLRSRLPGLADRLEVRVSPTGEVSINGWADVAALDELLQDSTPAVGRGSVR
ncbi:4Fe-4S single cluster domain-containing protein [Terrabacter lapilli]|uniref:4Fe-4S single cluster domain-containing protein n=1 Tax=Terrabacter lapilli TaxID=436231 RepID=A0ABN2S461_9MICO